MFLLKMRQHIKLCKHAEKLNAKIVRAANWQLSYHTNFVVIETEICGTLFKHYLHENKALHARPDFLNKI